MMKEDVAKLQQWKEDWQPIIKENSRKLDKIDRKIAKATGIIVGFQIIIPFIFPSIVKAFNNLF